MAHGTKNGEKKLLRLGINIRFWGWIAVVAIVAVFVCMCGESLITVIGIYLAYRIIRLAMQLFGLAIAIVMTLISILAMVTIIIIITI